MSPSATLAVPRGKPLAAAFSWANGLPRRWLKRTRRPALQTLFTNFYSARCLCLAPEAQLILINYPYSTACTGVFVTETVLTASIKPGRSAMPSNLKYLPDEPDYLTSHYDWSSLVSIYPRNTKCICMSTSKIDCNKM